VSISTKHHKPGREGLFPRKFNYGWLFIIPAIISFLLFKYYPIIMGVMISFFDFSVMNPPGRFVGFGNYIRAFKDPLVWNAARNNVEFWLIMLAINQFIPLFLAVMVDEVRKCKTLVRTFYYLPALLPGVVTIVLWKYFWQPDYGLANYFLTSLGGKAQLWLNDTKLVKLCMRFPGLVMAGGMDFIIYLAALNGVNREMYESAQIDGASFWRRLFTITIPSISSTIVMLLILSTIGIFNLFDGVMIMTGGGPVRATETLVLYAFQKANRETDYSYAITIMTIAFLIVFVLTIIQMKVQVQTDD
jgi:multiple sugar transport system permease protein